MGLQVAGWLSGCQFPGNSSDPKARKLPHLEVARGASHAKGVEEGNIMLDAVFLELVGVMRGVVVAEEEPDRTTL